MPSAIPKLPREASHLGRGEEEQASTTLRPVRTLEREREKNRLELNLFWTAAPPLQGWR